MQVDYIIVGQGISGTMLSYHLLKRGKKVMVVDEFRETSASRVASGVINPVTGRRIVSTWMIDELLPFAWDCYKELEEELGVTIISQKDILSFHASDQMQRAFCDKMVENGEYVATVSDEKYYEQLFHFQHGIGLVTPVYLIDLANLLTAWRNYLQEHSLLLEANFNWDDCIVGDDGIRYENITAQKIILCDGVQGQNDPYFKRLPFAMTKGEAIIASIPDLSPTNIYKQGYNIVPWKDNMFWIGSSFDREYEDLLPSSSFKEAVTTQLNKWLKLPYKIVDHIASERAGTIERRPFVGLHPVHQQIGIFNGMGTKGCSLAPYFADEFAVSLIDGTPINELADISRFKRILERS